MTAQQLKNSILQMAVQGKLVPQDPGDEPASVLLERIKAEKQELIKAGKIKKDKKSSEIFRGASHNLPYAFCEQIGKEIRDISDEIPFEIPDSWEWVRLGGISYSIWAGRDKPDDFTKVADDKRKIPVVANGVTNDGILGYTSTATANSDTITIAGRGTIGFSVYRTYEYCPIVRLIVIEQAKQIDPKYLQFYLMYMPETSVGSSIPQLTVPMIQPKLIPLPPIEEQHRIVAKIEEILPYIEKYGKAEEHLTALNTTFPEALKKSILQEAVQGKLVTQNPDDEPASVLLERIRAEKQALIKAGKIKRDKHESVIVTRDKIPYEIIDGKERCIADEVPFELPESWCWCRFTSAIEIATNLVAPNEFSDYLHIAPDNIQKGNGVLLSCKTVLQDNVTSPNHLVEAGTIIYSKIRPLLRKAVISPFQCLCSADMYPLKTALINKYVLFLLLSDCFNFQVASTISSRVKMPKINQSELSKILIPVPPLEEQKRIVAKIEELMPFIGNLTK